MLLLFTPQLTSRLVYIANTLFSNILNIAIELTSDKGKFRESALVKLNYSFSPLTDNELWIQPHPLLFSNEICKQTIECFEWNGYKVFFKTDGDIPFDIFAASFYLISRYEEYLPYDLDEYKRYSHRNSLAYNEKFLRLPLTNLWMKELQKLLQKKFPEYSIPNSQFHFLPTYDIDIAFSYLHHSYIRNAAGFYKELLTLKWEQFSERINVLMGRKKDPFDVSDWIDSLHEKYKLNAVYFFLIAEKRKRYDKNISPYNNAMQQLIKRHAKKYKIGIHPSWQSGDDKNILKKEIDLLRNITIQEVTVSRQHYIRMTLPETYRLLIENDIKEDYSMGYGSINGFRASITSPFYWYNLKKDEQTDLMIYPFCYMEANSFFEQGYTATQAAEELQEYYDTVESVKGELITIFHNHFLTTQETWIKWRKMYEMFLQHNCGK